jgi:spore maturation protein CgeB
MKHYSIVRISGAYYPQILSDFYSYPKVKALPYQEQKKRYFDQKYGYGDAFSLGMKKLGHDSHELLADIEIMQKKYAQEKGITYPENDWKRMILEAQINELKPDILYFQDVHDFSVSFLKECKQKFPFVRKVVIYRGFPGYDSMLFEKLSMADLILVGSPLLLEKCNLSGLKAHLVHHYFDASVLPLLKEHQEIIPFSFLGSSGVGHWSFHRNRYDFLKRLLESTNLYAYLDEKRFSNKERLKLFLGKNSIFHPFLRLFEKGRKCLKDVKNAPEKPLLELFPTKTETSKFGLAMYQLLHDSQITFNCHSNVAQDYADNIRLFQATGVGSCLLTNEAKNMRDLFQDDEVVTYSSFEECLEKVRFLQNNEKMRKAIADKGQKRALNDHSMFRRCELIDHLLQKTL